MSHSPSACPWCGSPLELSGHCPTCERTNRRSDSDQRTPENELSRPRPSRFGVGLVVAMVLGMMVSVAAAVGLIGYAAYVLVSATGDEDAVAVAAERDDFDITNNDVSVRPTDDEPATGLVADSTVAITALFADGEERTGTGLSVGDNLFVTSSQLVTQSTPPKPALTYWIQYTDGKLTPKSTAKFAKSDPITGVALLETFGGSGPHPVSVRPPTFMSPQTAAGIGCTPDLNAIG